MKEIRDTPRSTMSDEEMVKDYPRLAREYTLLHQDYREAIRKPLNIPVVVQAKPEKVCELVRQKFDDWVFGLETQEGEKLKVVDSTDFNEIITEIESELKDL